MKNMSKKGRKIIRLSSLGYSLGGILLGVGLILSLVNSPVMAASSTGPTQMEEPLTTEAPQEPPTTEAPEDPPQDPPTETPTGVPACTPPENWDGTTRLFYSRLSSKEWHFEVDEPEMDVTLVFFYYQDFEKNGCPKDCGSVPCQSDEIGEGDTPLGSFSISDGQKAPSSGKVKLHGRLPKGSYTTSFHVTGKGSINIGMKVQKSSVPPTATPTAPPPSPTQTQPVFTPTSTLPVETPTATPDSTTTFEPPNDTPTATPTGNTPTPTEEHSRPRKSPTPLPPTLAPPTPPPGTARPPALVPVTGGDPSAPSGPLAQHRGVLMTVGISLLGLGLIFHGISRRLKDL
jgi:hypothetical protein